MRSLLVGTFLSVFLVGFSQSVEELQEQDKINKRVTLISDWSDVEVLAADFDIARFLSDENKAYAYNVLAREASSEVYDLFYTWEIDIPDSIKFYNSHRTKIDSVLLFYAYAIQLSEEEKFQYQLNRLYYLESLLDEFIDPKLMPENLIQLYRENLAWLKENGYKETRDGFAISFVAQQGMYPHFGAEISLVSEFQPRYKNPKGDFIDNAASFVSLFKVGYMYHPARRVHDVHFTLLEVSAPFHVDITQFGFSMHPDLSKNAWFYRPQVGYSFERFSLFYSYNFIFRKSNRDLFEKHTVGISFQFIPFPFKNSHTFDSR